MALPPYSTKMSANNEIIIKKVKSKWRVIHNDLDCGPMEQLGDFNTLEEAVDKANEFEGACTEEGYGVEYGLRIIK